MNKPKLVRFDWAIKYLLRNKANFDILEGFLSELLKTSIHIENVLESESNKNHVDDKFNRVDLLVKTAEGRHVIVEVQCSSQWDYLSRILYGASKVVCEHILEGDAYKQISKVISVSIVFFNLGDGKDYLYKGSTVFKGMHYGDTLGLNQKEREIYKSVHAQLEHQTPESIFPEYYIIKVTQFHERVQDKLDEWIYFLKHGEIKQEFSAQGIQSAAQKLDVLRLNKEERRIYAGYQESLHDEASFNDMVNITQAEARAEGRAEGRVEGRQQGLQQGELKAKQAMVRKLLAKSMPLEEIVVLTELSLDEIKAIAKAVVASRNMD